MRRDIGLQARLQILLTLAALPLLAAAATSAPTLTPAEHQRAAEQTFLTYPEWYLVHSPNEMAGFFARELPARFPYFAHIGQFWSSYGAVYQRTRDEFPFNGEYHAMLNVIGISTTLEYAIKGAYESTIGHLSEATAGFGFTDEDHFAAGVAQAYVDFILERPWYEFDYFGSITRLWTETPLFGPHMLRKLERKYILTSEYLVKAIYAKLIGFGSAASFDAPVHQTAVIVARAAGTAEESEMLLLPRYQPFTDEIITLAQQGVSFSEIAGNRGRIAVSLLGEQDWNPESVGALSLFLQPLITRPGTYRHIVEVDVAKLSVALRGILAAGLLVEHVYDY